MVHTTGISDLTVRSGITSDDPSSLNERGAEKSDINEKSISIGNSRKVPIVDYKEIEGEESYDFDKNLQEYEARNNVKTLQTTPIEEKKEIEEETIIVEGNESDEFCDREDSYERDDLDFDHENDRDSPLKKFKEDGSQIEEGSEESQDPSVNVQTFNQKVEEQTYTESELVAYKKEIDIAIEEQLLRESQAELIMEAMAKRLKGPQEEQLEESLQKELFEKTIDDEMDSGIL